MPAVFDPPETDEAEPTTAVEVPFWQKYNAHFEFPSSVVLSVLTFVTAFAVIVGVLLLALAGGRDSKPVPIQMVYGEDADGAGSAGSGGIPNPLANTDALPTYADTPVLPNTTLPEVKDPQTTPSVPNPLAPGQLTDPSQTAFQKLVEELRNPQAAGGRKGAGPSDGKGSTGQAGSSVGGNGNDNTHKRSLRWRLLFSSVDGRDYVNQLAAMKAVVIVPQPPEEKDAFVFRDLRNPRPERLAEADWTKLATQIQFIDTKPDSVKGVADALGVNFTPKRFMAFFPQELEAELARKELTYRNRRAEDIEETAFKVTVRGGAYDIVVSSQTAKR